MKPYTDITLLIDRSGSMSSIKESMESGLREFLKQHKKIPSTHLTVIQFDSIDDQFIQTHDQLIRSVEAITISPRGNTPLIDAFVKAIDGTGNRLRHMASSERPDQVLFVVITDGEENASKLFSRAQLRDRVETQREKYAWQFIYLGANQDAIREGASYGIPLGQSLTWNPNARSIGCMFVGEDAAFANTINYTNSTGAMRGKGIADFTAASRTQATSPSDPADLDPNS